LINNLAESLVGFHIFVARRKACTNFANTFATCDSTDIGRYETHFACPCSTRPKERSDGFYTIEDVMPLSFHFVRSTLSLSIARLLRRQRKLLERDS